jgi:hydrogenase maturation protease
MTISTQILVIGYGRCDRGDDAIGPQIAAAIGSMSLPQVTARAVDRLTPELASHLATANGVIFIDACKMPAPATVRVKPLQAIGCETSGSSTPGWGHGCDPQSLLALTHSLYGHHPQAWWVEVPADDFRPGQGLSPVAQQGMVAAVDDIMALITGQSSGEVQRPSASATATRQR